MNTTPRLVCCFICSLLVLATMNRLFAFELLDDRAITIRSARDAEEKRRQLIQFLWGDDGFPKRLPDSVSNNIPTPVRHLNIAFNKR